MGRALAEVPEPIPDLDAHALSTSIAHPDQRYLTPMAAETVLENLGFIDEYGYVVELADGKPTSLGEATYFTAVAATALALNNYIADEQSAATANKTLEGFLEVLQNKSWGKS